MTSRMRKPHGLTCRSFVWAVVLSALMNFIVAYSCGFRAGLLNYPSGYSGRVDWPQVLDGKGSWRFEGEMFGISGWYSIDYHTDPAGLFSTEELIHQAGLVQITESSGTQLGWPLQSLQSSWTSLSVTILENKLGISERVPSDFSNTYSETTPSPHWYYKGIQTGLNNSVLYRIPVQIRPVQFAINSLFYGILILFTHTLVTRLKHQRRHHRGLCPECGYSIETNRVCPECGSDHAARSSPKRSS
jgi:hypothetical protein